MSSRASFVGPLPGRPAAIPTTAAPGSFTLKLTGIVIKSDPRGSYKPSRVMDLLVDGEPRTASFQLRESQSTLSWEVKPAVAITNKSIITLQPYEARTLIRRKRVESVTVQGDAIFRFCSGRAGDKQVYERVCTGYRVLLSVAMQRDTRARDRSLPGMTGHMITPGENGQELFFGPHTAPNSFKRSLESLIELMKLFPSESSNYETARITRTALKTACEFMPTDDVENDVQHLGEEIHELLVHMQAPKYSERLVSQVYVVPSILNLIANAATFAEDCSKPEFKEELGTAELRKASLEDYDRKFARLKRNFTAGKDNSEYTDVYYRKQIAPTPAPIPSFEEDDRSEASTVEPEPDAQTISLGEEQKLSDSLSPDFTPTNMLNQCCLEGTRRDVLYRITSWFDDPNEPNVLWLTGAPGTGKTTIAWSLIAELEKQQRSAGEFFFRQNQHSPYQLWRSFAYKMAKFHPAIKAEVYNTLVNDNDALDSVDLTFEKLIVGPLKATEALLANRGPIILIDGLEQCAQGYDDWKTLLETLPKWSSLPHHCKLVVTSRPQDDIQKVFEGKDVKRIELLTGDVDSDTNDDIRAYLNHRFAEMRKQDKTIPEDWPDWDSTWKLVEHASGFFKWAAIAADGIQAALADRERHLSTIIDGGPATKFDSLDEYLEEILRMAFGGSPAEAFRATMGTIALSKEPLTMNDLEHFLDDRFPSDSGVSLEDTCYKLLPMVSINGDNKSLTLRHKVFKEYLTDPKRCTLSDSAFLIDQSQAHRKMTVSCLKVMQKGLKFNICELKSSYMMNFEIEDKDAVLEKHIPSYLAYACQFWADHLRGTSATEKRDTEIVNLLRNFLHLHILYWLEVLSLLGKSNVASRSLLAAAEWLETTDKDLSLLAADASRFALTFADVIADSAPHIYMSALPFAPPSSLLYKRYHEQFPRTIKVLHEEEIRWPAMRFSIPTNNSVYAVSIHPDGKRLAAGMASDTNVLVVAVATGETLFKLTNHGSTVRAVAYSPSGKRIATGCDDRRLRIFEAENGALIFGPFELHSDWIRSVAWSTDGQRIVTGSDDRKVKVVAVETGQVIYDTAFHNDWVRAVLYTQEFFLSGSDDRTVRIYDAATGAASGEAWVTGQTGYIRSIAISPDNRILAAGSDDSTIVLYNMETRTMIGQPLRGHTGSVRALIFSKDGQRLASGSEDYTIRLWDVQTGRKLCDPLHGHTNYVAALKFSPDMKQLISGGEDYCIRFFDMDSLPLWGKSLGGTGPFRAARSIGDGSTILACDGSSFWRWDMKEGQVENKLLEDHTEHLTGMQSAAISPDGKLVATAARDRAVIIWDAEGGKALWGPLEGHMDDIYAVSFSYDGKMVASGSDDQKVWVWSAVTGERVCGPLEGHTGSVRGICFSPDGKQVASGSNDNTAIIWSVESGEKVHEPLEYHRDWVYGLAYSPDGLYLATGSDDYSVVIWDVATGERVFNPLTGHGGYLRAVNWSSDSKRIVTGALDNTIRVFDVEAGTLLCEPLTGHSNTITAVAFCTSSFNEGHEVLSASMDGTVRVWGLKVRSFTKMRTFSNHSDWVHSIAVSPVDDLIVSSDDTGKVVIADIVTGDFKTSWDAHSDWIRCVAISADGKKIATCSDDRTISVWNISDGERLVGPFDGHTGTVLSVEFSPGGNFLISGSEDTTVQAWDIHPKFSALNNPLTIYRGHKGAVNAVAYARGGSLIVSGSADAEIAVWEGTVSDRLIMRFGGHEGAVLSIRVSGEKIFSSSEDKTIRIWDLSTGRSLVSIIHGHTAPINAIALSPDGMRVVSVSDDASLRIFDSETGEPCTMPQRTSSRLLSVALSRDGALVACGGTDASVLVWRVDMIRRAVWPDGFIRKIRKLEFCMVDDQGVLSDFSVPDGGWLRGSKSEAMVWIPSVYRTGLWTPRTVGILGALETALDLRSFVHGTRWEQCRAEPVPTSGKS